MANITNILQGNFLKLTDNSKVSCLFQSNYENEKYLDQIYKHTFDVNYNDPIYNLVTIDFGLDWIEEHKNQLKNPLSVNDQTIFKLDDNKFGIFFFTGLVDKKEKNQPINCNDKDCLKKLLVTLEKLQDLFNNKNAIVFLKNIEVLEVFFDKEDLALFFAELTTMDSNKLIRQMSIKVKTNTLSKSLHEALMIMTSSMISVESELLLQETKENATKYLILQLTQKKPTGYSFQQLYKLASVPFLQQQKLEIEKITNVNDLVQKFIEKNEEKDLQKVFNTTFSFQMSQTQKQNIDNIQSINPHFEAMQLDRNWNNFDERLIDQKKANIKAKDKSDLIQLEGEDMDQEIEDEDDFDV